MPDLTKTIAAVFVYARRRLNCNDPLKRIAMIGLSTLQGVYILPYKEGILSKVDPCGHQRRLHGLDTAWGPIYLDCIYISLQRRHSEQGRSLWASEKTGVDTGVLYLV